MMVSSQESDRLEDLRLAPYAVRESASRGRRHAEARHDYRGAFQRDRDRIIHSRAFRRLEYKTQVFVNGTADHYRTRLTHTIEMAAVARTLARALRANEDLAEAIALAHDLGHSPFGHSGERALNELMQAEGGFDHNLQGLRCVERLEYRYPEFTGLNLSWEVRAGLLKHQAAQPGAQLDADVAPVGGDRRDPDAGTAVGRPPVHQVAEQPGRQSEGHGRILGDSSPRRSCRLYGGLGLPEDACLTRTNS